MFVAPTDVIVGFEAFEFVLEQATIPNTDQREPHLNEPTPPSRNDCFTLGKDLVLFGGAKIRHAEGTAYVTRLYGPRVDGFLLRGDNGIVGLGLWRRPADSDLRALGGRIEWW